MRKIKKLAALCMAGVMAASMAACSGGETAETTTAAPATTAAETRQKKLPQRNFRCGGDGSVRRGGCRGL